ncbi:hypothetical protein D9V37_10800 [Nocardioides mangrovicus]|uniref:Uncharacterized protein n=1 Tax=Nocardioides mangrovicus TaxID=2478913 RepID=A0A3L8P261_9ACTN|nr:hypothetical protein [Nocardioides mangrovicus]RLV49057.1 hypothetical protein D9V37_10800 [Nocardioides mangrovicus]
MGELRSAILVLDQFLTSTALNSVGGSTSWAESSRASAAAAYDLLIGIPEFQEFEASLVRTRLQRLQANAARDGDQRLLRVVEQLTGRD